MSSKRKRIKVQIGKVVASSSDLTYRLSKIFDIRVEYIDGSYRKTLRELVDV